MNIVRNNESQYVAFFMVSGSIKRFFSIDYGNVFLNIFTMDFARRKGVGLPHIAYIAIYQLWSFYWLMQTILYIWKSYYLSKHFSLENSPSNLKQWLSNKAKKCSCFRKCRWREKSWPGRPQIHFLIDFQEIFSFTL